MREKGQVAAEKKKKKANAAFGFTNWLYHTNCLYYPTVLL